MKRTFYTPENIHDKQLFAFHENAFKKDGSVNWNKITTRDCILVFRRAEPEIAKTELLAEFGPKKALTMLLDLMDKHSHGDFGNADYENHLEGRHQYHMELLRDYIAKRCGMTPKPPVMFNK